MADGWIKAELGDTTVHNFEDEPELVGTLVKVEDNVGPNGSTMYTIKNEAGEPVKMWGSTVLDDKMGMIPLGSEVKIVYNGKVQNEKTKRTYKSFDVYYKGTSLPQEEAKKKE